MNQGLSDAPHGSAHAPLWLPADDVHVARRPPAGDCRVRVRALGVELPLGIRADRYGHGSVVGSVAASRVPSALVAIRHRSGRCDSRVSRGGRSSRRTHDPRRTPLCGHDYRRSRSMAGGQHHIRALAFAAPSRSGAGGTVLAVPWWAHRRRRARVRVERTLAAWPEIAHAVGLAGSRVMSAVVDVWGWRARFALARGQTITDVIAKLPAIESGLGPSGEPPASTRPPDDLANRFELRVLDKDPHADAITWPGPSVDLHHRPDRPRPVRGRHARQGPAPAPARPVRRRDRVGQERRPQCAHGQPHRVQRRGDLGHRPQARHGTRPLGALHRPAGHHPRRSPRAAAPTRSPSSKPAPSTSPPPASASGQPTPGHARPDHRRR